MLNDSFLKQINRQGNYIIFFDKNNNHEDQFIQDNLKIFKNLAGDIEKTFVYLPNLKFSLEDFETLCYYFPLIRNDGFNRDEIFEKLLYFYYHQGVINRGFIITHNSTVNYYEYEKIEEEPLLYFKQLCNHYRVEKKPEWDEREGCLNAPHFINYNDTEKIEVEDEIQEEIKGIIEKMEQLKSSGNIILALPLLEKVMKSYSYTNSSMPISRLVIDEDFRIFLKDFKIEIKLSHLTKALYIFFLLKVEGCKIEDLPKYKPTITKLYTKISNKVDISGFEGVVENLCNDKDAVYVHLSRIKSEFYKKIQEGIAKNYIVQGERNEPKEILLDREMVNLSDISRMCNL